MIPVEVSHQSFLVAGKQPLIYNHMRTGWTKAVWDLVLKKKNPNYLDEFYTLALLSINSHNGVPRNFFREGVQQIQLRTEDRKNGDLGTVAP
jgi:hypothetical protein